MARGFNNNIRVSEQEGWKQPLQPIIVVHDSNTNYVPVEKIFEIRKFYDVNYTDYSASYGPKIRLLFDLLVGESYESACEMKTIDENTIEFNGSADSLIKIYDKIMNSPSLKAVCNVKREDLVPNYVQSSVYRFILENGTSMVKDLSNYTIQFKKITVG